MTTYTATEILINANRVTADKSVDTFEFVLNKRLQVVECVELDFLNAATIYPVGQFLNTLSGVLFELNHVRVNPHLDNAEMITRLVQALAEIGVEVYNRPSQQSMAICYRPLGEITQNVRFYFNEVGHCVFLCPQAKLHAVPDPSPKLKFGR